MIREKQELQHSLNIDIQKRLFAERELDNAYKSSHDEQHLLEVTQNEVQQLKIHAKRISEEKEQLSEKLRIADS